MKKLICIICPRGCHLEVSDDFKVSGNFCKRGEVYAINELTNPTRIVTSTVTINNGEINRCPVVTSKPIPKEKIFDIMNEIHKVKIDAPIMIKDVIIKDILGLNIDVIATRTILKKNEK